VNLLQGPPLFCVVLKMIGQALRRTTLDRITVLQDDWAREIRAEIDPENWPKQWGGSKTEGIDPMCSSTVIRKYRWLIRDRVNPLSCLKLGREQL
jgi:hypothetical protein